jgi:hypothetical protein
MDAPQRALVVTDDLERAATWMGWCRRAGYTTTGCVGPGRTLDCPRIHGAQCVLREVADVAIVDLSCDDDADLCTKLPKDGSSIFVRRESPSEPGHGELMERLPRRSATSHARPPGEGSVLNGGPCPPFASWCRRPSGKPSTLRRCVPPPGSASTGPEVLTAFPLVSPSLEWGSEQAGS